MSDCAGRNQSEGSLYAVAPLVNSNTMASDVISVIAKSGGALKASPKIGIYLFAIAVLLSLVVEAY